MFCLTRYVLLITVFYESAKQSLKRVCKWDTFYITAKMYREYSKIKLKLLFCLVRLEWKQENSCLYTQAKMYTQHKH